MSTKKPLPDGGKIEHLIEDARLDVEGAALRVISERLAQLFKDPAFEADLLIAAGKKKKKTKTSQRYLDDIAEDIKERVLKDIARIYHEGLY